MHGEPVDRAATLAKPYGCYTGPSQNLSPKPRPMLPNKKKNTFRKTIILVSLAPCATSDKPSSSKSADITYTVVTQMVITLEANNCGPAVVAELVKQQVGYDVTLLDSKCFPVLDNDTTRSMDYWKLTRKILAASKVLYKKLKGTSADPEKAKVQIDLTDVDICDESPSTPIAKRQRLAACGATVLEEKVDEMLSRLALLQERLDMIEDRFSFANTVLDVFDCIICRAVTNKPLISLCCNRLIGCNDCVGQWLCGKGSCPLCSTKASTDSFIELKGMDQALVEAATITRSPDLLTITGNKSQVLPRYQVAH